MRRPAFRVKRTRHFIAAANCCIYLQYRTQRGVGQAWAPRNCMGNSHGGTGSESTHNLNALPQYGQVLGMLKVM